MAYLQRHGARLSSAAPLRRRPSVLLVPLALYWLLAFGYALAALVR